MAFDPKEVGKNMNRAVDKLRIAQVQALNAQLKLREIGPLPVPSKEACARAATRIAQDIERHAALNQAKTPQRRIEQRRRMGELKAAARDKIKRLRQRLAEESPEKLRTLRGKVTSFDAIDRRRKSVAPAIDPRLQEPHRETTLIIETTERSKPGQVANDVAHALDTLLKVESDRSWVKAEPLYRKHRVDQLFRVDIAILRRDVFRLRFRLAAYVRKSCGYKSVQYERGDSYRLLCDWRRTEPAPSDSEWSLRLMNVLDAWNLTPPDGGERKGRGVVIGHPDTGWNEHPEYDVARIDLERSHNAFFDSTGEDAAKHQTFLQAFPINNLTHGTGTGSVIVSGPADDRRTQVNPVPGGAGSATEGRVEITGVAPRATIVPVRCVEAVELAPDNRNFGRAIEYLMDLDDPPVSVISISCGGAPHYSLEEIIRRAVTEKNIIVVAAAGQYAFSTWDNSVVEPADYQDVIAVTGCTDIPHPWSRSLQGPRVAVSAAATGVYCADYENNATVKPIVVWGDGTSFSAAEVAGIAALWVAFWGRDTLLAKYDGQVPLAHVFRQLLMQTANPFRVVNNTNPFSLCSEPWPTDRFGAGVVDAAALLAAALPDPGDIATPPAQSTQNIVTLIPDMDHWFQDRMREAAKLGEDACNEVRQWLDEGTIWLDARAHEAERAANELGAGLLSLWNQTAAAAEDTAGAAQRGLNEVAAALGEAWQNTADAAEDAANDAADDAEAFVEDAGEFIEDVTDSGTEAVGEAIDAFVGLFGP